MSRRERGRVRIVSGASKGRLISVPEQADVRPTSEMVREAVFDVLGPVGDLVVLDLFAGSGALGIEALSRGAKSCVFVEADRKVARVLCENVSALQYDGAGSVLQKDYRSAVEWLVSAGRRFDLLFLDPPYRMLAEVEAVLTGAVRSLLTAGGVIVIEGPRSSGATLGETPVFERVYGDTKITMVRVKE